MEVKFTKGPWSRNQYGALVGPDGKSIEFRSMTVLCSGSRKEIDQAEANTTLAAAAPAMHEAINRLLVCMSLAGWESDDAAVFARSALKSAQGEENHG